MRYELYYWPGIQGRGEFIRLALEEAAADYIDVVREPESAGGGVPAMFELLEGDDIAHVHFAPPILKAGKRIIAHLLRDHGVKAPREQATAGSAVRLCQLPPAAHSDDAHLLSEAVPVDHAPGNLCQPANAFDPHHLGPSSRRRQCRYARIDAKDEDPAAATACSVRKSDPATAPVTLLSNFRAGNRLRTAVEPPVGFNRNGSLIDDSIMSAPERNTATAIVERLLRVSGFAPTTYIDLRPMYDGYKKLDSQKRLANATHAIALAKTTLPLTKENLILFASNKLKITSLVTYAQQSANEAQTELQEFVQRETTLTAIRTVQSRLLDVPGPGEPLQSLGVGVHNIVGIVQTTSKAGKHDHRLYIGQPDKSIACVKSKGFITDALLAHQDETLPFKSPLPNKARGDKPADTCFINPAYDCTPFGTFEITELHVTLTYAKINGRLTIGGNVLYEPAAEPRFGSLDAMETESTAETAETAASPFGRRTLTRLDWRASGRMSARRALPSGSRGRRMCTRLGRARREGRAAAGTGRRVGGMLPPQGAHLRSAPPLRSPPPWLGARAPSARSPYCPRSAPRPVRRGSDRRPRKASALPTSVRTAVRRRADGRANRAQNASRRFRRHDCSSAQRAVASGSARLRGGPTRARPPPGRARSSSPGTLVTLLPGLSAA